VKAAELIELAKRQVAELTGLKTETVSSFSRDGDENWIVKVEALELTRVPSTMDVLGTYEVTISNDGELVGFRRARRYHRSSTEDEG
jgi:Gas vesicle synthesis protein GvpO